MYQATGYVKSEFLSIERSSDERLADLAELDPRRLIAMILAAREAGASQQALRATWILASATESRRVIGNAVRRQTFESAECDLDEFVDGAHLKVLQQIDRTAPKLECLEQFYSWMAEIARRHVIGVTRLKSEKRRLRTDSLSNPDVLRSVAGALDIRLELAPKLAIINEELQNIAPAHRAVIIHHVICKRTALSTVERIRRELGVEYSPAAIAKIAQRFRTRCGHAAGAKPLALA
jgi:hypothetical protein